MYIFAADLSAAQRRSILGHKNFHDSDWSANNPQPSSEPIGKSCALLGDMLLVICRNVPRKFIELGMEMPHWCPTEGHQYRDRMSKKTSGVHFCYEPQSDYFPLLSKCTFAQTSHLILEMLKLLQFVRKCQFFKQFSFVTTPS